MRIVLASDHAGLNLRRSLIEYLEGLGHAPQDLGPNATDSVDYPDFAYALCEHLLEGHADLGILICGTGIGMSMCANKVQGIRAALCGDVFSAGATRAHNNANVLCLGARVVGDGLAKAIVEAFVNTPFEGGRHQRRLDKMVMHTA